MEPTMPVKCQTSDTLACDPRQAQQAPSTTYYVSLDGGQGGETEIEECSIDAALVAACEWAEEGDWPDSGCYVYVQVWSEDEDGDVVETKSVSHEILSSQDRELEDGDVLAERVHEFDAEQIVRVDDSYYLCCPNGGHRGAWNRQCGDGVWRDYPVEPTRLLDLHEVRALLLDWGYEPQEVARLTRKDG
jgi:hypothetical protein